MAELLAVEATLADAVDHIRLPAYRRYGGLAAHGWLDAKRRMGEAMAVNQATGPTRPSRPRYRPSWGGACLCGSGRRYHECCRDHLPGFERGDAYAKASAAEDWKTALIAIRADVTQYTIWHRSNTAPPGRVLPDALRNGWLFGVDIAALSELIGDLLRVYCQLGRLREVDAVLTRLATNIVDPRWDRKIVYHRSIAALVSGRSERARTHLAKLPPVAPTDSDIDLLQLHLDLNGDGVGFTERRAYFDQIVRLTKSRADKIQYLGARAFDLLMMRDVDGARTELKQVRDQARAMHTERPLSGRGAVYYCLVLQHLAIIERDDDAFAEVTKRLSDLLKEPGWTRQGRSNLMKGLGDAYRYWQRFDDAIEAYQSALGLGPAPIIEVFVAECLVRSGNYDAAMERVAGIETIGMDRHERADHAFVFAIVALVSPGDQLLQKAQELLAATHTPEPYFETERLKLLVAVQQAQASLADQRDPVDLGPLLEVLDGFSRYVQLQPNVAGLGINLNNVIDDYIARKRRDAELRRRAAG